MGQADGGTEILRGTPNFSLRASAGTVETAANDSFQHLGLQSHNAGTAAASATQPPDV
jgi:hypothetical protein